MPFSGTTIRHTVKYWTEFYEDFLKPLIESNSTIAAHRSEALRGDILSQIITDLIYSDVVVADLTDANPNVYWELGVRQSFAHRTITIMESGQELPFDLGIKGTLRYDPKSSQSMEMFKNRFSAALYDCLANPKRPDSHVLQTITGRGTVYEIVHHEESERRLTALLSEVERSVYVLTRVTRVARANNKIKDTRAWRFPTVRFTISATELLITHRYLDASDDFYHSAERFHRRLTDWNEQLNGWALNREPTQQWIMNALKRKEWTVKKVIEDFRKRTVSEREGLLKRI